ncbi:uncharacterized protein PAC_17281 [Phialocephala subalpina]|uniref:Uncharacterized protein n=1 Tax=Phialocephala subalpina TaxID=576137 RepID=A0A1L7XQQ5_9HELO|nr:uncharacterized protein PAC_17281 [Phialocephala subalpina]
MQFDETLKVGIESQEQYEKALEAKIERLEKEKQRLMARSAQQDSEIAQIERDNKLAALFAETGKENATKGGTEDATRVVEAYQTALFVQEFAISKARSSWYQSGGLED